MKKIKSITILLALCIMTTAMAYTEDIAISDVSEDFVIESTLKSRGFRMFDNITMLHSVDTYKEKGIEYTLIEYTVTEEQQWFVTKLPNTEEIIIRQTVKGAPVIGIFNMYISEKTFSGPKSIVLPETITRIEDGAFYNFISLQEINIPASVNYIGEFAFGRCMSLQNVTLPDGLKNISSMLFEESGIVSVNIPETVVVIGKRAFADCSNLSSISLPNEITYIGVSAFENCSSLRSVTLPNNIEFQELSERVFCNCIGLKSVEIPYYLMVLGSYSFAPSTKLIVTRKKTKRQATYVNYPLRQQTEYVKLPPNTEMEYKKAIKYADKELRMEAKKKISKTFEPGNHYREYGVRLTLQSLSQEIGIMSKKKVQDPEIIVFKEKPGKGSGFYTGRKENNGNIYTWSASKVAVENYGDLIRAGALFTEPVYIDYENKTIPLTAMIDDNGNIVSDVGIGSEHPIQAMVDVINKADIWYCTGMTSDIRNQYSKLSAFSVLVGKCAEARANANGLLLKDIARLTGVKVALNEKSSDIDYTDEDLAKMAEGVAKFDEKIKDKLRTSRQLTSAMNEMISYTALQGAKLGGLIARDIAYIAGLSAQIATYTAQIVMLAMVGGSSQELSKQLGEAIGKIVLYAINTYGPTKKIQMLGKRADRYAKVNFNYGKKLMNDAKEKIKKQQKQFDTILADL